MIDVIGLQKTTLIQSKNVLKTFLDLVDDKTTSAALEGKHFIWIDIDEDKSAMAAGYLSSLGFTVFNQGDKLHIKW